ncbi:hypothetical protein [Thalassotalea crassostreae]|uniref:hypothetical protein n=1 Tax=Thalassotalea crassostreae TaxID=1763536 RepID=UPI000838B52E|nr:hypothetical protein [Thalassotalea crassostreae]
MFRSPLIPSLASILLLSACGGGGGGGGNDDTQPTSYTLNISSMIENSCGQTAPYNDVELVLQDQDWNVLSTHTANSEGLISVTTELKQVNYTLVSSYKGDNGIESYEAVSYFQANTSTPVTYYATHSDKVDNSTCECVTQDLVLNHVKLENIDNAVSSTDFESYESNENGLSTTFSAVESCRVKGEDWQDHSFAVSNSEEGYLGFHQSFESTDSMTWEVYVDGSGTSVRIEDQNFEIESSQIFNGIRHFSKTIAIDSDQTIVFDSHKYDGDTVYSTSAIRAFKDESSPFGSVTLNSQDFRYSANYNTAFDAYPSKDDENIDYVTWAEIDASGSYDYSKVNNHKMAIIRYVYDAKNPDTDIDMPVMWTAFGPIEGQLPMNTELPMLANIIESDTKIDETKVTLLRHYSFDNYQEYINYYAELGNLSVTQQLDKKEDRIHVYNIELVK